MPMFDHSAFTDGNIDPKLVDHANTIVDRARSALVDKLSTRGPTASHTLAAYAIAYFQAHMRRALEFLDGGMEEMSNGRALVATTCARSVLESVACFHDFCRRLTLLLDEGDMVKALTFIVGQAFATKMSRLHDQDLNNVATNVVSQVDRLDKLAPGVREVYNQLSETTHPNGIGAVGYFVHVDHEAGIAHFQPADRHQINLVRLLGVANFLEQMLGDMRALATRIDAIIREDQAE
ncbi:hypothetical protein [Bradyrhizobium sp. LB5.2]|uniref:hypothetical protein n=1 Tax=unclassified Bradyrhizobium TaxID=2631580 RepID=UPI00339A5E04